MDDTRKVMNVALSGGGVKGIAFIGAFNAIERRGYMPGDIAGVSAGSIAGAFAAAGYDSSGMWNVMDKLDFGNIEMNRLADKVPAIKSFLEYYGTLENENKGIYDFLASGSRIEVSGSEARIGDIFKNIVTYCKDGCLFDGDLLEDWISSALQQKGIRTFSDLRGGAVTDANPRGYKIRMTGVDCSRLKLVTFPDDLTFYDIDPDSFEVAKAVRISTAVPFAFKPVELAKTESGKKKVYYMIDGGMLDSFPAWLLDNERAPGIGLKLNAGESKLASLYKPLDIFKGLISTVHDLGIPSLKDNGATQQNLIVGEIETGKVGFLDFKLTMADKRYLYNSGMKTANSILDGLDGKTRTSGRARYPYVYRLHR